MSRRPNLVFILADDHAAHAISAYGSRVNQTPNIDRLATDGARLNSCYCTNSICTPSRASILTGTYSHVNGVTTLATPFDYRVPTFASCLRGAGYRTALFGKWHLGHSPENLPRSVDFDDWQIFPGQGKYNDPVMINAGGGEQVVPGYATDIVTDLSLDWLADQPADQPFCLMMHHKAPHRPWVPDPKHSDLYPVGSIPEPGTLFDSYQTKSRAVHEATLRVTDDLVATDVKEDPPAQLWDEGRRTERTQWFYQRYMREYLQTIQSVDDNVGRVLDYLDDHGLTENTLVIYSSDQGFFLGDHGWYDKRFIYEESLQMPFLIRWPGQIPAMSDVDEIVTNVDFAATFLDACGVNPDAELPTSQGRSALDVLRGDPPSDWQQAMYYRYWQHDDSSTHTWAHYGMRTKTHKLVYFYADALGVPGASDKVYPPEWEMYDLIADPHELNNVADDPAYSHIRADLKAELARLQAHYGDEPYAPTE